MVKLPMPKQKPTKPTNIYWLYDLRPEKVAVYGESGEPFYCGKTIFSANRRLKDHIFRAKTRPTGRISARLMECETFVVSRVVEVVPVGQSWVQRERHWISELRALNPNCVNVGEGGTGTSGFVFTTEQRERVSRGNREYYRKNPEARERIAERMRGTQRDEKSCNKQSQSMLARWAQKRGTEFSYFVDPDFDACF